MAEGSITEQEYMDKLEHFVRLRTRQVEDSNIQPYLRQFFDAAAVNYKDSSEKNSAKTTGRSTSAAGRSRTCRKPSASKQCAFVTDKRKHVIIAREKRKILC